jgi:uncharacterized membrane protein YccC
MKLKTSFIIFTCLLVADILLVYFSPKQWSLLITSIVIVSTFCFMGFSLNNVQVGNKNE